MGQWYRGSKKGGRWCVFSPQHGFGESGGEEEHLDVARQKTWRR